MKEWSLGESSPIVTEASDNITGIAIISEDEELPRSQPPRLQQERRMSSLMVVGIR